MENKIQTVSQNVDIDDKYSANLDQALSVVGFGWYNFKYCLALAIFLISAIVEPVGYSYVLPAAMCDLNMTDSQRGLIASVPYIGVVITSFPWGYLVDTKGRKMTVIYSSLAAGFFGILAGFMPDLISFTACKFLTSLCIACPSTVPYTFIGEITPAKNRDIILSVTNALQIFGSALVPLFAWAILPLDFRIDFGAYIFRPWRLLTMINASIFIIGAIAISFGPESPKFLVSDGKPDEALKVLQIMYAKNKNKSVKDFPIKRLEVPSGNKEKNSFVTSLKVQTLPLLKPPYIKWLSLNGFLLFGIFSILNGLYQWVPDVINRVMTGTESGRTACEVIGDRLSETSSIEECNDSIETVTFIINSIANICCTFIAIAISSTVKIIGKKRLLIAIFIIIGVFCILINFITQEILFAIILSSFPIMGLAIGPVNASAVEIFPTNLRGMAVSLTMMVGRMGSIFGTNVAGVLINAACEVTFYLFGGLLLLCGGLSFLLPNAKKAPKKKMVKEEMTRL